MKRELTEGLVSRLAGQGLICKGDRETVSEVIREELDRYCVFGWGTKHVMNILEERGLAMPEDQKEQLCLDVIERMSDNCAIGMQASWETLYESFNEVASSRGLEVK